MNCITLLSDFGLQDASVAIVKGILMQELEDCNIIDISHDVAPYHLQQAAYLLASAYKNFPDGTCHLLLMGIFYDEKPVLMICKKDGHYFLAPDNGILPLSLGSDIEVWKGHELDAPENFTHWIQQCAAICKQLNSEGATAFNTYEIKNTLYHTRPKIDKDKAECQVIHIDRFGNVVINITQEEFERAANGRQFRIEFMRNEVITRINHYYHEVREGEKLCRFNSAGYMEIAINKGEASNLLGLKLLREKQLLYNTINIFFE